MLIKIRYISEGNCSQARAQIDLLEQSIESIGLHIFLLFFTKKKKF